MEELEALFDTEEAELIFADPKQEKKIKHYSSNQKILLVGEGNFSFAACLAKRFGSAKNITATSLDSKESVIVKYSNAASSNLKELEDLGCVLLHEVDVHTMRQHPLLVNQRFDRVVFNFPHAGFIFREIVWIQIKLHQSLVRGFFASACEMLNENGEVHVTHKTAYPFNEWEIVKLAEEAELSLVEEASFSRWEYPGYVNMRGSGIICDQTFPVGECSTYKFAKLPLVDSVTKFCDLYEMAKLVRKLSIGEVGTEALELVKWGL